MFTLWLKRKPPPSAETVSSLSHVTLHSQRRSSACHSGSGWNSSGSWSAPARFIYWDDDSDCCPQVAVPPLHKNTPQGEYSHHLIDSQCMHNIKLFCYYDLSVALCIFFIDVQTHRQSVPNAVEDPFWWIWWGISSFFLSYILSTDHMQSIWLKSSFSCNTFQNPLIPQVILKDLEVLAEIASSPAGQTYNSGMCDSADSKTELQVPEHSNIDHQLVVGEILLLAEFSVLADMDYTIIFRDPRGQEVSRKSWNFNRGGVCS